MKNFSTWMIFIFAVMYWAFRIIVAYTSYLYMDFMVEPINMTIEIVLLFVTFISFIFIAKRKMFGALLYSIPYLAYFGADLIKQVLPMLSGGDVGINNYMTTFTSFIAIVLAFLMFFDTLLDHNRKKNEGDKKTDWFYKNKEYDRKFDDRADKNNYKTM